MALSWNEIKDRALKFSNEWSGEERERAEKDTFWNEFFNVFGISRRRVANFEEPVKKLGNKQGYIDLFWIGTLLVEQKSKGKDLDKAYTQAIDYFPGLKERDLPKYVLVSDFEIFKLYDLDEKTEHEFHLKDFYKNVKLFGFISGYQKQIYKEEDPVNIKAAELMGKLHDQLKDVGYVGHPLEVYLVRLLFILFADDTAIFEKDIFKEFLEQKTNVDGSNLGPLIAQLFQVLNTPNKKRLKNLDEYIKVFPYVNGKLFEEVLPIASFNSKMRNILLETSALDWGKISPSIFGSLFQSVMNPEQRRNLGAHYTSEKNILKLIKPLFLDELRAEFEKVKVSKPKLREFHQKLANLKFLDPACGSGNFLIITYRELRQLELEILRVLYDDQLATNIENYIFIDVDQFFGIEYDEFASKIAEVAMWLIDHQMNMKISEEFGQYFARLPLKKAAKIVNGNALRIDWNTLVEGSYLDLMATRTNIIEVNEPLPHYETINVYSKNIHVTKGELPKQDEKWSIKSKGKVDYILGNPPFVGKKEQKQEQKEDMKLVFEDVKGAGVLDYVTAWYIKAAQYIQGTKIKAAFVSTNSISQGEQVGILWNELHKKYKIKIHFAHSTFKWSNEAKINAAVHVVIIGFASYNSLSKELYVYENITGEPLKSIVKNINAYLVEGEDLFLENRKSPICNVQQINYGSFALDNGHFTISKIDYQSIISQSPSTKQFIKPFLGGKELLRGIDRYCIWLKDINPNELMNDFIVKTKIENVKHWREKSNRKNTRKLAFTPALFAEIRQPENEYLAFPTVSSSNRNYIPIAFLSSEIIASNQLYVLPNATKYDFGIMTSSMHMLWIKYVAGRLKNDYRYSSSIVYNNYPWPINPSEKNIKRVKESAQKVLDIRTEFPGSNLADLYNPLSMPPKLVKAHQELDKAVDLCYRPQSFITENARIEFLFELYNQYTTPMFSGKKIKRKK